MAQTEAHKRAVEKYNAKAYKQLNFRVKANEAEKIKKYAEAKGMSLNGYINKLIADDMGEALTVPNKQQGD